LYESYNTLVRRQQGDDPILLPIDQLRTLLEQRKIVVSGAVQRLVEGGVIAYADKSYHTGKAREFQADRLHPQPGPFPVRERLETLPGGRSASRPKSLFRSQEQGPVREVS